MYFHVDNGRFERLLFLNEWGEHMIAGLLGWRSWELNPSLEDAHRN
jgi:hypothetical protein